MIRLTAIAFALAFATSAQAMPLTSLHQPDGMITQVREACGGVCTALMAYAFVLPRRVGPPSVQLECGW
jgi:hypothetical protein